MPQVKIELVLNESELAKLTDVVKRYQESEQSKGKKGLLHVYNDELRKEPYDMLFRLDLIEAYGSQGSIQYYVVNPTFKGLELIAGTSKLKS